MQRRVRVMEPVHVLKWRGDRDQMRLNDLADMSILVSKAAST